MLRTPDPVAVLDQLQHGGVTHTFLVPVLLAAMAQVPDTRLVIVGDGTEREDLRRRAGALGIADRVDFVGWQDDARPAIESFDVFALGSRDEAFPLTIVEAMLGGTPVVATDVGSVAEAVVQEETGLLVPPGDVPALAGAIRRLLDDDALRGRLASAARARAEERFTDVAMARGYDALWSSLLAR
jgi:glycosyltransferase involved in cell wall biosynthesis